MITVEYILRECVCVNERQKQSELKPQKIYFPLVHSSSPKLTTTDIDFLLSWQVQLKGERCYMGGHLQLARFLE